MLSALKKVNVNISKEADPQLLSDSIPECTLWDLHNCVLDIFYCQMISLRICFMISLGIPKHATFPTIDGDYGQLSAVAAEMMKNGLVHGNVIFMRICGWFFGREIGVSKLILKYGNERQ